MRNGISKHDYEALHTFGDAQAQLSTVATHQALCALVEAVDERFIRDRPQISMSDADWVQWTTLVANKAALLDAGREDSTPDIGQAQ